MTAPERLAEMQRRIVDALAAGGVDLDELAAEVGAYADVRLWRSAVETLISLGAIRIHNALVEAIPRTIFPTDREHETTWKHFNYFIGGME